MIEYSVLGGVNDRLLQAHQLGQFCKGAAFALAMCVCRRLQQRAEKRADLDRAVGVDTPGPRLDC